MRYFLVKTPSDGQYSFITKREAQMLPFLTSIFAGFPVILVFR